MLPHADTVTAGRLGPVERPIGGHEQRRRRSHLVGERHHARARTQRRSLVRLRLLQLAADPLGKRDRLEVPHAEQHHGKLLAADPGERVAAAPLARRAAGEVAQGSISDRVPETVIDLLEVVEVEQHERQGQPAALRPFDLAQELCVERPSVEQPRQVVGGRRLRELIDRP